MIAIFESTVFFHILWALIGMLAGIYIGACCMYARIAHKAQLSDLEDIDDISDVPLDPVKAEIVDELREKILSDEILRKRIKNFNIKWETCGGIRVPNIDIDFSDISEDFNEVVNEVVKE